MPRERGSIVYELDETVDEIARILRNADFRFYSERIIALQISEVALNCLFSGIKTAACSGASDSVVKQAIST